MSTAYFWTDRPTFVSGATGLIGGWLVRQLIELKADVVCLVRDWVPQAEIVRSGLLERVKVVRGDIRDGALLERTLSEYEVNTVIHLAAQSIVNTAKRDPANTFDVNTHGTWALLEACRCSPLIRSVVLASTDKVYGEVDQLPYTEEMPLLAKYPHDASKACAEMVAGSYAATYHLPVAITRLPNIFGGGDLNWSRIIPGTIRSTLRGQATQIQSNGRFIRDYLYVEDAAAAHLLLAEQLAGNASLIGHAFNLSNETHLSVLELVELILRLMGSDLKPQVLDRVKQAIQNQYLSAEKARRMLGWQPHYSMSEGLQQTIDWYRVYFKEEGA